MKSFWRALLEGFAQVFDFYGNMERVPSKRRPRMGYDGLMEDFRHIEEDRRRNGF